MSDIELNYGTGYLYSSFNGIWKKMFWNKIGSLIPNDIVADDLEPEVTKASAAMVWSNLGSDDGWLLTTANSYSRDHTSLTETLSIKKPGGYSIIMPQNSCFTDPYISIPPK